jgi:hypothetical protein
MRTLGRRQGRFSVPAEAARIVFGECRMQRGGGSFFTFSAGGRAEWTPGPRDWKRSE